MFEGIPTWPDAGRFWDIVGKHKVNILYTAPTAIRSLMGFGLQPLEGKDLSSLKILGTVGEPINEEAWHWYSQHIGKGQCPIVDTWWQTETGGVLISNLAGITAAKPGWATLPMPGVQPVLVDEAGKWWKEARHLAIFASKLPGRPFCVQRMAIMKGAGKLIFLPTKIYILPAMAPCGMKMAITASPAVLMMYSM
jgi:acyl-coenzyme A synthetase/AMP-(fatty) acid ligase